MYKRQVQARLIGFGIILERLVVFGARFFGLACLQQLVAIHMAAVGMVASLYSRVSSKNAHEWIPPPDNLRSSRAFRRSIACCSRPSHIARAIFV